MERRTVDLGGEVHFDDYGGEGRPLVLVHGLGGNALNWVAAAPLLAREARVLAVDLLGHGRTLCWGDRTSSMQHNQELLARFVEEVTGTAALVGNSMGGLLAMLVAADRPDLVEAVVMVDAALPVWPGDGDPVVAEIFQAYFTPGVGEQLVRSTLDTVGAEGLVLQTFTLCARDVSTIPTDVLQAHVREATERRGRSPRAIDDFLTAARTMGDISGDIDTFLEAVRRVRVPTLVVHGAHDRLIPLASARALAGLRPDWTLEVMADSGHIPMLEEPEAFSRIVLRWLASAPSPSSASPESSSSRATSSPETPPPSRSPSPSPSPSTSTSPIPAAG